MLEWRWPPMGPSILRMWGNQLSSLQLAVRKSLGCQLLTGPTGKSGSDPGHATVLECGGSKMIKRQRGGNAWTCSWLTSMIASVQHVLLERWEVVVVVLSLGLTSPERRPIFTYAYKYIHIYNPYRHTQHELSSLLSDGGKHIVRNLCYIILYIHLYIYIYIYNIIETFSLESLAELIIA